MRALLVIIALVTACGDNKTPGAPDDAGVDATPDAPLKACLDRPDELPRPTGALPCELLPPGFAP